MSLDCIVLAAGLGTRMKSAVPKVMHAVAGRSLLGHVLTAVERTGASRVAVIVGPGMEAAAVEARRYLPRAVTAVQDARRGTAHAVGFAASLLAGGEGVTLIVYGDVPLIRPQSLERLAGLVGDGTALAVLGFHTANPTGYGRLVLDAEGRLEAIREELDAAPAERTIDLCNSGVMAVRSDVLWRLLPRIGAANAKGEHYLTDLVALVREEGLGARHAECEETEVLGVNTRIELARIEHLMQERLRKAAMEDGASLVAPETVFLGIDTRIGRDVVIEPHVVVGPGVSIGDGVTVRSFSHLERCEVRKGAVVGPFARLRPGAVIGEDAHIGNFVEVKNAVIAPGAKANHLAYIGDASVGENANIGAGTITCNYDGYAKHRTEIGARAFIGTNSSLVAPVKIGEGAYIGSGSVVTEDVPAGALALERSRMVIKEGWADRLRDRLAGAKARKA